MFADLLADIVVPPADEAVVGPGEAAEAARAPRRSDHGRRGRVSGFRHSDLAKARIAAGKLRADGVCKVQAVASGFMTSAQSHIMRSLHPEYSATARRKRSYNMVASGAGQQPVPLSVDTARTDKQDRDRVLASHVHAQATAVQVYLASLPPSSSYILFAKNLQ